MPHSYLRVHRLEVSEETGTGIFYCLMKALKVKKKKKIQGQDSKSPRENKNCFGMHCQSLQNRGLRAENLLQSCPAE